MAWIRYTRVLNSLATVDAVAGVRVHILRTHFFGYGAILLVMISLVIYSIGNRAPVGLDVIRDRGVQMYRLSGGTVQNVYTLRIHNLDRGIHHYDIQVQGDYPFSVRGYRQYPIEEGEIVTVPVRVELPRDELDRPKTNISFELQSVENPEIRAIRNSTFIGPP